MTVGHLLAQDGFHAAFEPTHRCPLLPLLLLQGPASVLSLKFE